MLCFTNIYMAYTFSYLCDLYDRSHETTWSTKLWSIKPLAIPKLQFTPAQFSQKSSFLLLVNQSYEIQILAINQLRKSNTLINVNPWTLLG